MGRKGANSSNRGAIKRNRECNIPRVRDRARNPKGVWGCLGGKRNDKRTLGRHLSNRDIYMYFKDFSVVKSHKSDEVIMGPFMAIVSMGGSEGGPTVGFFRKNSPFSKVDRRDFKFRLPAATSWASGCL